jgi:hypothetical protein
LAFILKRLALDGRPLKLDDANLELAVATFEAQIQDISILLVDEAQCIFHVKQFWDALKSVRVLATNAYSGLTPLAGYPIKFGRRFCVAPSLLLLLLLKPPCFLSDFDLRTSSSPSKNMQPIFPTTRSTFNVKIDLRPWLTS